jgi:hypothetical protein
MKTNRFIFLFFIISLSSFFAQVNMEIGNNLLVETAGGVYISGVTDVVESGTGYLKGVVESSSLSGTTQFAGLTFSNSFTGIIKRTTGTSYAKGNGEGQNFKRYYELNNTDVGGISTSCNISCITSGTNDESLGMTGPYFLYRYQSDWRGYGDGSNGTTVVANSIIIPNGSSDLVISEGIGVDAKIYMEGPYNSVNNEMNTTLNADIPLTSPYSEDPRTAPSKPSNAVDWVLVQLRETSSGPIVESRSAFINKDGFLIDDNGNQGIGIKSKPGDYYIIIKHRNHLGIMTATAQIGLTWGN